MMARSYTRPQMLVLALCRILCLALLCLPLVVSSRCSAQDLSANSSGRSANPSTGQGLLSRLRTANAKPKETMSRESSSNLNEDAKDREPQDRRWSGAMRVPLQSFNLPWSNRNSDPKSSIQDPIDLPSAIPSKRNAASERSMGNPVQRQNLPGDAAAAVAIPRATGPIGRTRPVCVLSFRKPDGLLN